MGNPQHEISKAPALNTQYANFYANDEDPDVRRALGNPMPWSDPTSFSAALKFVEEARKKKEQQDMLNSAQSFYSERKNLTADNTSGVQGPNLMEDDRTERALASSGFGKYALTNADALKGITEERNIAKRNIASGMYDKELEQTQAEERGDSPLRSPYARQLGHGKLSLYGEPKVSDSIIQSLGQQVKGAEDRSTEGEKAKNALTLEEERTKNDKELLSLAAKYKKEAEDRGKKEDYKAAYKYKDKDGNEKEFKIPKDIKPSEQVKAKEGYNLMYSIEKVLEAGSSDKFWEYDQRAGKFANPMLTEYLDNLNMLVKKDATGMASTLSEDARYKRLMSDPAIMATKDGREAVRSWMMHYWNIAQTYGQMVYGNQPDWDIIYRENNRDVLGLIEGKIGNGKPIGNMQGTEGSQEIDSGDIDGDGEDFDGYLNNIPGKK